jgi:hypothetical protein
MATLKSYLLLYNHPDFPNEYTVQQHYYLQSMDGTVPPDDGALLGHWRSLSAARAALPPNLQRLTPRITYPNPPTEIVEAWAEE